MTRAALTMLARSALQDTDEFGTLADIGNNLLLLFFTLSESLAFLLHRCVRDLHEGFMIHIIHP